MSLESIVQELIYSLNANTEALRVIAEIKKAKQPEAIAEIVEVPTSTTSPTFTGRYTQPEVIAPVTVDAAVLKVSALLKLRSREAVVALLAKHGAKKVTEVKDLAAFIADVDKELYGY